MADPDFWHLLPHATACVASGMLILLDLRQDHYFHVPATLAETMLAWLEADERLPPPLPIAQMLERSGIARPGDPDAANGVRQSSAVPETLVSPTWLNPSDVRASTIKVAAIVTWTWLNLRRRPLRSILNDRATPAAVPAHIDNLVARCAAFDRARAFAPQPRRCLLDSLALSSWLAPTGVRASLVFGVTARPFAAHCWLQVPGCILNDSYDHVSRFTPILIA